MPKRIIKALIGGFKPPTPKRSLPSYKEPTPESNPKLSREEEAEAALKHTAFTSGTQELLIALFLLTIVSVATIQFLTGPRPSLSFRTFLHAAEIKSFEKQLESDSTVSQWLLPPTQSILTVKLGAGSEQVYLGGNGWLFYRPDVDYVTGPPFLAPVQLKHRVHVAQIQPDPLKAIIHFRDQLAARGIELVVLPVPTKATIEGEMLNAKAQHGAPLQNTSFADFTNKLSAAGVRVLDPAPTLMERKSLAPATPLYLQTDTHWRPETMEFVAHGLAPSLQLPDVSSAPLRVSQKEITAPGDVARMLKLPTAQEIYRPEKVAINQVTAGNNLWRPSRDADVLLLGDSFVNIFSLEALGWGESAGFAEHLSNALGGRPLDCILRNSDGAFATREMLANELARGRDRLAGKKLVIWEFAARELAFGNWKLLDLKVGQKIEGGFFSPKPGGEIEVAGLVDAVSSVPRPGTVPYQDHVMAVQLGDLHIPSQPEAKPMQALVYLLSMRANVWTQAARLRPGDRITVRLRAWSDISAQYEQINRSEIDDPAVQLEEPTWGELSN